MEQRHRKLEPEQGRATCCEGTQLLPQEGTGTGGRAGLPWAEQLHRGGEEDTSQLEKEQEQSQGWTRAGKGASMLQNSSDSFLQNWLYLDLVFAGQGKKSMVTGRWTCQ